MVRVRDERTEGAPTHQFKAFKSEHGLLNHVIFRLSFCKLLFLLSVRNAIRLFLRAMDYYYSGQSQSTQTEKK